MNSFIKFTLIFASLGYSVLAKEIKAEETIRLGAILPISGPMAAIGEGARRGYSLAAQEINNSGGIGGRSLEIIYEDSAGEPTKALSALHKLEQEVTYPIIFSALTSVAQAIKFQADKRGLLLFIESTMPKVLDGTQFAMRNFADANLVFRSLRKYVETKGIKRVILLRAQEEWAEGALAGFKAGGTKDVQIIADEQVAKDTLDIRPQLLRLKAKSRDAELFIIMLVGATQATAINQSALIGLVLPKATFFLCSQPGIMEAVGKSFEGNRSVEGERDINSSEYKEFLARYIKAFKSPYPEFQSLTAYDSLMIIQKSIEAGAITPGAIKKYIIEHRSFSGVVGITTFDKSGDAVRGGQIEVVADGVCTKEELL